MYVKAPFHNIFENAHNHIPIKEILQLAFGYKLYFMTNSIKVIYDPTDIYDQ